MNILRKNLISLIVGASVSSCAIASQLETPSLHNPNVAISSYLKYKETGAKDPFLDLGKYSEGYESYFHKTRNTSFLSRNQGLLSAQSEDMEGFLDNSIEDKFDRKREIYNSSFSSDGDFDPLVYAEMYSEMLKVNQEKSAGQRGEAFAMTTSILNESSDFIRSSSFNAYSNSTLAKDNLINALNSESYNVKLELKDRFNESLGVASDMSEQGLSTIAMTSQFLSDCGSACSFPEPQPVLAEEEVVVEPEPVVTVPREPCVPNWRWWKDKPYLEHCD